ncbi:MAG: YdcF family protein [Alphaproteobacteria bacterium]|jgi:uncharacterized SAM-binding protein YcdF (DUF218 family)|nr:YdcF family protein [Alphaproteobacteria bacterium]
MRHRKSRRWRLIATITPVLAIGWLVGLFVFVEKIPQISTNAEITDAVVVLTGGPGRINRGNELLAAKKARIMLVSGVGADVPVRDLISAQDLSQQMVDCCVTLGRAARDTRENAIESAGWAASRNIASIRLVTSDFHMPRSMLEFKQRLPHMQIVPEPVSSRNISLQHWWKRGGTAWLLAGEYSKYLAARTQLSLTRLIDRN